jgi:hypothetical protein
MIFFRKPVSTFRDHAVALGSDARGEAVGLGRAARAIRIGLARFPRLLWVAGGRKAGKGTERGLPLRDSVACPIFHGSSGSAPLIDLGRLRPMSSIGNVSVLN